MKEKKANGAAWRAQNGAPPSQGKKAKESRLRAKRPSAKELARRAKIKAYFDTLDEDAQIREFEKLSIEDKHWLAWAYTYEEAQQGKRLT